MDEEVKKTIEEYLDNSQYRISPVPAHAHTGADSQQVDFNDLSNRVRYIEYRIVDYLTNCAVGTGIGGEVPLPFKGYITGVGATVDTAGTTNSMTINVLKGSATVAATTVLNTDIYVDSTKKSSRVSVIQSQLNPSRINFLVGDILSFNVDTISTTPAKGLTVFVNVVELT